MNHLPVICLAPSFMSNAKNKWCSTRLAGTTKDNGPPFPKSSSSQNPPKFKWKKNNTPVTSINSSSAFSHGKIKIPPVAHSRKAQNVMEPVPVVSESELVSEVDNEVDELDSDGNTVAFHSIWCALWPVTTRKILTFEGPVTCDSWIEWNGTVFWVLVCSPLPIYQHFLIDIFSRKFLADIIAKGQLNYSPTKAWSQYVDSFLIDNIKFNWFLWQKLFNMQQRQKSGLSILSWLLSNYLKNQKNNLSGHWVFMQVLTLRLINLSLRLLRYQKQA